MASYLLDTHIVLWSAFEPERLSAKAIKIISDPKSGLFLSSASVWEMAIKHEKGTIELKKSCETFVTECVEKLRLSVLSIQWHDCIKAASLPKHHLDPFDRMIVQHAKDRGLELISTDAELERYGVKVVS